MLELLGLGVGIVKDFVQGRRDLQQAEIRTAQAVEDNKARLAASVEDHNSSWEMAQLSDKDKGLRRVCFVILMAPFVYAMFDPQAVTNYFDVVLDAMPEWYINIVVGVIGAIWGFSYARTQLPSIIGGIMDAIRGRK